MGNIVDLATGSIHVSFVKNQLHFSKKLEQNDLGRPAQAAE